MALVPYEASLTEDESIALQNSNKAFSRAKVEVCRCYTVDKHDNDHLSATSRRASDFDSSSFVSSRSARLGELLGIHLDHKLTVDL